VSAKPQAAYAEAHRAASQEFRKLSREQMRERLQEAGVLGVVPHVADKVRVLGRLNVWHYGVVIGADREGRVHVVHNEGDHVVVRTLREFARGQRVQLVERPPEGRELAAAARAAELVGQRFDLSTFEPGAVDRPARRRARPAGERALGVVLAALGLAAAAVNLSDDNEWAEATGRYRDSRGRFAPG